MTRDSQQVEGTHQGKRHTSRAIRQCAYCPRLFAPGKSNQRYCSTQCRKLAHHARKAAAIETLKAIYIRHGMTAVQVEDAAYHAGMEWVQHLLHEWGYRYEEHERAWRKA